MKVDILGVLIDNLTFAQALEKVETFITEGGAHYVVTPYAESIVRAQSDPEFRAVLNKADLAVPDGISLLMAAKYLSEASRIREKATIEGRESRVVVESRRWKLESTFYSLPSTTTLHHLSSTVSLLFQTCILGLKTGLSVFFNRPYFDVLTETVKGTDLMLALCKLAAKKGWRILLLGGWNGVGEETARVLRQQYPTLSIESTEGCRNVEDETEAEWLSMRENLARAKPDLLFVAYGPVVQEKWLAKHLSELSAKVVIGVAGAFDMISGRKRRAPVLLRNYGLEWLWRLFIEPTRLRRIITAFPYFPLLIFRKSLN